MTTEALPADHEARNRAIGVGLAALGAGLFSLKGVVIKLAFAEGIGVSQLLTLRMAFSLPVFIAACIVTRGIRFFLVAWLFKTFGPALAPIIEKRIGLFMLLFVVVLVGGFVAASMLH